MRWAAWLIPLGLFLVLTESPKWASASENPVPKLTGHVNDLAGMLSLSSRDSLETSLRTFEEETSNQIVLLTLPTLGGEVLEDFAVRVARSWKLGQKGRDNGVLFLVAQQERRIRIEVGYGLEGALTDVEAKLIISDVVVPAFREGRFEQGIVAGTGAIVKAVQGEFQGTGRGSSSGRRGESPVFWIVFLALFALSFLFRERRTRGIWRSGGFYGGIGGGFGGGGFGGGGSFGGGGASGGW